MPVTSGSGVHITGLRELRGALRRADPAVAQAFQKELKAVGMKVAADARKSVPVDSGLAKASIRAVSGGNRIFIAGGKARVPYYGWLDFGGVLGRSGGRRNRQVRKKMQKGRFIYPAIDKNERFIIRAADRAFSSAKRKVGL